MKICRQCLIEKDIESFRIVNKYRLNKCKQCYNKDPKTIAARLANKVKKAAASAAYRKTNKETLAASGAAYRKDNKEPIAVKKAAWQKDNKAACNATDAKRRSAKLNRTPKWTTEEDLETIKQIYIVANQFSKSFGTEYQVDHIIPLQGKLVSGLHVPSNLQVITATENKIKGNKFEVSV